MNEEEKRLKDKRSSESRKKILKELESKPFTYDYDGNIQRGAASAGKDAPITIVAGNAGNAKPVVATGVISKSKSISITLTAEADRAYLA